MLYFPGVKNLRALKIKLTNKNIIGGKDSTVALEWAKMIVEKAMANQMEVQNANVIEMGPGAFIGVAALLSMKGAKNVTMIDVSNFVYLKENSQYLPFVEKARQEGWIVKDRPGLVEEIVERLDYLVLKSDSVLPVQENTYDLVYSFHVGEHLRSPRQVIAETYRILKPGGICIHAIDLCDHIGANRVDNWLKFLYYEPWLWELMSSNKGFWTNRLRSPQWREIFEEYFEVIAFNERKEEISPSFDFSKLAKPFKEYDLDTLSVGHLNVIARKKTT